MTDEKQVPGTPGGSLPGKPAGSPAAPEGGAPKATDLEALRAKLGFKPTAPTAPTAASPSAPKPGLSGIPGGPGAPGSAPSPGSKQSGPKSSGSASDFRFGGGTSTFEAKALSPKEMAELDASLAKASKPFGKIAIMAGVALLVVAALLYLGIQMGKGVSDRVLYNQGIAQAKVMKTYFTKGLTDPQAIDAAIKGEPSNKLKSDLEAYLVENQEILAVLMEGANNGRLPDGLDWEDFKKTKLAPLKVLLNAYLQTAPTYQADAILGGEVFDTDIASEVSAFVGGPIPCEPLPKNSPCPWTSSSTT